MKIKPQTIKHLLCFIFLLLLTKQASFAQHRETYWTKDGYGYFKVELGQITEFDAKDESKKKVLITKEMLTPEGKQALLVSNFSIPKAIIGYMILMRRR